jgi:hypothetical protein
MPIRAGAMSTAEHTLTDHADRCEGANGQSVHAWPIAEGPQSVELDDHTIESERRKPACASMVPASTSTETTSLNSSRCSSSPSMLLKPSNEWPPFIGTTSV